MTIPPRPEAQTFLDQFFAPPNQLRRGSKPEIAIWLERLGSADPLPSVLPCWRQGKEVDWYGLAFDDRQLNALGESLTAFVGPTYTTFRGQIARLDPTDPIDRAVSSFTGGRAFKFRGTDPADIWRALERMRKTWIRRGSRDHSTPMPLGRVLRGFYMALGAGEQSAAEDRLSFLRDQYHLDGVNALYLRVQLFAAFRRWTDLLSLPELPDLLRLRRPGAVTEALLQAVYHLHLFAFEDPSNPEGAVTAFRSEVFSRFGPLLVSRAGMQSPEAAKVFMLLAVAKQPPDLGLRDSLLLTGGLRENDREYLAKLGALAGPAPPPSASPDPLVVATESAFAHDFDRALAFARAAPLSLARARLLCECAIEIGTLEARSTAVAAVNGLDDPDRTAFLARRINQQLWNDLKEDIDPPPTQLVADNVPPDWCTWLDHLDEHDGTKGAREIARRAASEWSVAAFFADAEAPERFAVKLQRARSQAAETILRDCLPHLLAFFQNDSTWPNAAMKPVFRPLLDLLYFSTDSGRSDLIVWNALLDAALAIGVAGITEYRDLLGYTQDLIARYEAPNTLDWALDGIGLLVAHPCPDADARRVVLVAIFDRCIGFLRHIEPEQRDLLQLSAGDLGEQALFAQYFPEAVRFETEESDVLAALKEKSVAVYSLTESAARQFKTVLEIQVPGIKINLCHDLVASGRLKQLARQADIFLVATGSAKHAATACIEANRSSEMPLLRASGKGAASLLRAVREHLTR